MLIPRDAAHYGILCALATFSRSELREQVLMNSEIKKVLDASSPYRHLVTNFHNSNYSAVFQSLDALKDSLILDMWIAPHINSLFRFIRDRAMCNYFQAYTIVNMNTMAAAFNVDVNTLERSLASLIADNKIAARIDSQGKTLQTRHADQRTQTYQQSFNVADRYTRDVRCLLMRMSLIQADLAVKPEGSKDKSQHSERVVIHSN